MERGFFLSLDGPDGAGKSTQCLLLAAWLRARGYPVTTCIDPGGTELGTELRGIVLNHRADMDLWCEALLFMASRAQLVAEVIRPALNAADVVISDRFLLSTIVYQGYAGGLDPRQVAEIGRLTTGGLEPDLTLVLDVPLEVSCARRPGPADRVESRPADYQARVRRGFQTEAALRPDRIRVVDATASVEAVQDVLRRELQQHLPPLAKRRSTAEG
jgi:dTMP kinase